MGTVKYSGPIASFHCPTKATIRSLKVHFSPKQLGEETPSPENVRPIEGWDGVEAYHSDKTVVWNQWLKPYDSTNWQPYSKYINVTFSDGIATSEWVGKVTGYSASIRSTVGTLQSEGQIWYTSYMVKSDKEYSYGIEFCGGRQHRFIATTKTNEWYHVSAVDSYYRGTRNYTYVANCSSSPTDDMIGMIVYSKSPLLINLTQMFGAGNEPTKKEFESQCALNGIDLTEYHDYNEGIEIPWKTNNTKTYQTEFPVLGKNKFPLRATNQFLNTSTGWSNTNTRDMTTGDVFVNISSNNYWNGRADGTYGISISDGSVSYHAINSSYGMGIFVPVSPNTTYTLSHSESNALNRIGYYDSAGNHLNINLSFTGNVKTFTTDESTAYILVLFATDSDNTEGDYTVSNIQLELGSTATAYEPYDPNKTVYGGYMDVVRGELVVEKVKHIVTSTGFYIMNRQASIGGVYFYKDISLNTSTAPGQYGAHNSNELYSHGSASNPYGDKSNNCGWIYKSSSTRSTVRLGFTDEMNITTVEELYDWIDNNENEISIVYPLEEPITYSLASTQLQTFLSQNNIWSNADYVEVEYDLHETQDILARKQFIIASQPHIETLAAAPLQNFVTDMAAPLKECKVYFGPKQDLHGYGHPWIGGTGKNLFNINVTEQNPDDTTATNTTVRNFTTGTYCVGTSWSNWLQPNQVLEYSISNGILSIKNNNVYGIGYALKVEPETNYAISATSSSGGIHAAFYDTNGNFISGLSTNLLNTSFTTPVDAAIIVLTFYNRTEGSNATTATFSNIQFEKSTAVTTYEPYENICPIEGWNNININCTKKSMAQFYESRGPASVYVNGNSGWCNEKFKIPDRTQLYTYSAYIDNRNASDASCVKIWFRNENDTEYKGIVNGTMIAAGQEGYSYLVLGNNTDRYYAILGLSLQIGAIATQGMLELGDTRSIYEIYNGSTIPIIFPATKNLFDEKYEGIISQLTYHNLYVGDGDVTASTTTPRSVPDNYSNIFVFPGQVTTGASTGMNDICEGVTRTITPIDGYITIAYRNGYGVDPTQYHTQIEKGTVATAYEPYGTIYGGHVDLVTGEVVQEQIAKTFTILDSNQTTEYTNTIFYRFSFNVPLRGQGNTTKGITMCDVAPYSYTNNDTVHWYTTTNNVNGHVYVWLPKTFNNTDTITIVATLYTPRIIATLTPTQLKTLRGTNNIWSDANGNIELKYWTH